MTRVHNHTALNDFHPEAKWQLAYVKRISQMTDLDLFEEIVDDAGGDDYDGAFSDRGWWKYCYLLAYFRNRLHLLWIEGYKAP